MMKTMKFDKAAAIVAGVIAGRKRLGKQYQPPYIMDDVLDALVIVHEQGNFDAPSKEEITRLKRQLAACQNREKARQNKDLDKGNDSASSGDQTVQEPAKPERVSVQLDMFEVPEPEQLVE